MTAWLIRLRDRPIADQERRRAFIASTVLLSITVGLLALTTPAIRTTTATHRSALTAYKPAGQSPAPPLVVGEGPSTPGVLSQPIERVSRRFLSGYLAYLYGHTGVAGIRDVSTGLERSLAAHPPRVSFDMRARRPRVISLAPAAAPAGAVGVSALVSDGGVADYTVELLVSRGGGRLLVTGLGGA